MNRIKIAGFGLLLAILAGADAFAGDVTIGQIRLEHPQARAMLPGADVGGGYLSIVNTGKIDDRLVSVTAPRAKSVQLHQMSVDNGVMVMREIHDGIPVPAGKTLKIAPGGYHLMFMQVEEPFKRGESIAATLTFEKAGSVQVDFAVGSAGGDLSKDTATDDAEPNMPGMDMPASEMATSNKTTSDVVTGDMSKMDMGEMDHMAMGRMGGDPQTDIPRSMKKQFETADKPLSIEPVVVSGDWAIAGWTQDGRGGRALLRNGQHGWAVRLCSGDSLKDPASLEQTGVPPDAAAQLSQQLANAEQKLDPAKLTLFASFEGTVNMDDGKATDAGHDHAGDGK